MVWRRQYCFILTQTPRAQSAVVWANLAQPLLGLRSWRQQPSLLKYTSCLCRIGLFPDENSLKSEYGISYAFQLYVSNRESGFTAPRRLSSPGSWTPRVKPRRRLRTPPLQHRRLARVAMEASSSGGAVRPCRKWQFFAARHRCKSLAHIRSERNILKLNSSRTTVRHGSHGNSSRAALEKMSEANYSNRGFCVFQVAQYLFCFLCHHSQSRRMGRRPTAPVERARGIAPRRACKPLLSQAQLPQRLSPQESV